MDLKPLLNEHEVLEKGGDKIGLVGLKTGAIQKKVGSLLVVITISL